MAASDAADRGYRLYEKTRPDWAARFRVLKGEVLGARGLSKEALAALQQDLPAGLVTDEVSVRRKLAQAMAHFYLQDYPQAQRELTEAEQFARQYQPGLLGEVALNQGLTLALRDDYPPAETNFRRTLQLARQLQQPFVEARALGSLGLVYMRRQRFSEAIDWYQSCLKLSASLGARTLEAKTLGNLGWSYYKMGDTEKALSMFIRAEELSAQLGLLRDQQVWITNVGIAYTRLGDAVAGESYYLRALAIARKLDDKTRTAICLDALAALALDTQEFEKAEQYNQEALRLKRAARNRASELYSFIDEARIAKGKSDLRSAQALLRQVVDESEDISLRWEAQAELANVYALENKTAQAEQQFRSAIANMDQARSRLTKEEYRLSFFATATRFYNYYIDFLISRGRAGDALAVAEHSRGRALAEGLGVATTRSASFPNSVRPEQIAHRERATILAYWLKPQRSYLWVITPSKVALFALPSDAQIGSALQAYRKAIFAPRDASHAATAEGHKLYEMLVAPAQRLIPAGSRVVIVADGALHNLNFETLLVPRPQAHYWIEDVVISNASSLALLSAPRSGFSTGARELLLIGAPNSASAEYPQLAHAASEMQSIAEHFASGRRVVFAGGEATPENYRNSNPGRFSYIHFVAHGSASRVSPLDSAVVLSPGKDAYKLYARDIVKVPLRADLVTISTCLGAGTRNYSGEGLVGLSWAFLRAGAHNVVAALWEANDASTAQLMDKFYAAIIQGDDLAAALRAAKLAMLHSNTIYSKPIYWAPFQLYTGS